MEEPRKYDDGKDRLLSDGARRPKQEGGLGCMVQYAVSAADLDRDM